MIHSSSIFSRFIRWLHRVLYEECDDPQAPKRFQSKARKILQNQMVIRVCIILTWIVPLPISALLFQLAFSTRWLIPLYVVWCIVTCTVWLALHGREKIQSKKSGAELATEYSARWSARIQLRTYPLFCLKRAGCSDNKKIIWQKKVVLRKKYKSATIS